MPEGKFIDKVSCSCYPKEPRQTNEISQFFLAGEKSLIFSKRLMPKRMITTKAKHILEAGNGLWRLFIGLSRLRLFFTVNNLSLFNI